MDEEQYRQLIIRFKGSLLIALESLAKKSAD